MPCRGTIGYRAHVDHYYWFKRGDRVTIPWGWVKGATGVVDSAVFQRTVDFPDEMAQGYHVILDTGPVVTVRWDQVGSRKRRVYLGPKSVVTDWE